MLQKIKKIIEKANADYLVFYEESSMMEVKIDDIECEKSFAYIEEFCSGKFIVAKHGQRKKQMKVQIYFCKFTKFQYDVIQREELRKVITCEIIEPFINEYENSRYFEEVTDWNIYHKYSPTARFDANEVYVMLEFDCTVAIC